MPTSLFAPDFQEIYDLAKTGTGVTPSPADWRDQWIYFLMVDRFNNPARAPLHPPFDGTFNGYQGGSYRGVQAQLPYLKELGAGAIWLSPVLENVHFPFAEVYHGYGIHDFLRAERRFADNPANADDELRALVDAAHELGLYVIFDIVLNHTGDVFGYDGFGHEAPPGDFRRPVHWRNSAGDPTLSQRRDGGFVRRGHSGVAAGVSAGALLPGAEQHGGRGSDRGLRLAQAVPHGGSGCPAVPDPRLSVRDRAVRLRRVPHRHAAVLAGRPAAAVRQRHAGVRAEHRQEELLHVRRGFRRPGGAGYRALHRTQHAIAGRRLNRGRGCGARLSAV